MICGNKGVNSQQQLTSNSIVSELLRGTGITWCHMMQNRDEEDEGTTLLTEEADRSCDEDVILEGR